MATSKYPPVVVVDENDCEVGTAMLADVWRKGLYHRIVAVFVMDEQGRMLLQLRGSRVKIYPNYWDQAAGGHVDEGQSYEQAAMNEVAEELGLHNVVLIEVGTFRSNSKDNERTINQFERVYKVQVPHDVELKPAQLEVERLQWFTPVELKMLIANEADKITPGLLYDLQRYFPEESDLTSQAQNAMKDFPGSPFVIICT